MAKKSKSVLKTTRQAAKRRIMNRTKKQKLRKMLKDVRNIKEKDELLKILPKVQANIDKSVKFRIIHKNTAARLKSKIVKLSRKLETRKT